MTEIRDGNYGANIRKRNDGDGFDVAFLYNFKNSVHMGVEVSDLRTYKSEKMALKKARAWIEAQIN